MRIAILPIVVHSADDPSYLRNGLADMLTSRIEQAGVFEVVRIDDLASATTRQAKAIEEGRDAGAEFVLFGSFTRFGAGASLDMQCVSTRENFEGDSLREIFVHTGSIGEVIPDLEELVGKVGRFAVKGFEADVETEVDVASAPPTSESASGGKGGAESDAEASGKPDSAAHANSDLVANSDLEERIEKLEKAVAKLTAGVGIPEP